MILEYLSQRTAKQVRQVAAKYDRQARPVIVNDPEPCPVCHQDSTVFVWPYEWCHECWKQMISVMIERRIVGQLSFWSELVGAFERYRDTGDSLFDEVLTIDLKEVTAEDRKIFAKFINKPTDAIEQQLALLFSHCNLSGKFDVWSERNLVHISVADAAGAGQ